MKIIFDELRFRNGIFLCTAISFVTVHCATIGFGGHDDYIAANKIKEDRILQLERENSVIKKENSDILRQLKQSEAQLERISSDKDALQNKYNADIKEMNNKLDERKKAEEILIQENNRKIAALMDLSRATEKRITDDLAKKNEELKKAFDSFSAEREKMKTDFAHAESDYKGTIAEKDIQLNDRDRIIRELNDRIAEIQEEIKNHNAQNGNANGTIAETISTNTAPAK